MIQRCENLRFTTKPREAIRIGHQRLVYHLDRDIAIQLRVACPVDFTHPAHAEQGADFVRTEAGAMSEGQRWRDYKS
jgi:hypothetical protein